MLLNARTFSAASGLVYKYLVTGHSASPNCQVKIGVNRSLHDDAISVREAAVDLLGKHIGSDKDLALTFFDLIGQVDAHLAISYQT